MAGEFQKLKASLYGLAICEKLPVSPLKAIKWSKNKLMPGLGL